MWYERYSSQIWQVQVRCLVFHHLTCKWKQIHHKRKVPIVNSIMPRHQNVLLSFLVENYVFFYRVQDEHHETIKADGSVNNLAEAVELILKFNNPTT